MTYALTIATEMLTLLMIWGAVIGWVFVFAALIGD